jgi:hypothetical protein
VGTGLSSNVIDARFAALPSELSFATLLGRELGFPDQLELVSRLGGEKGRLLPDICDRGREAVDGCRSRRVLIAGEGGSDISMEGRVSDQRYDELMRIS